MSNTALKLSDAELELIEARRAEEAAKAETKRLEEEAKEAKALRIAEAHKAAVKGLYDKLRKADTKDVLFDNGDGVLRFLVGQREENVDIQEHTVYSSGYYRGSNRGLKYRVSAGFNNYSNRMMSNPKTVMKNIYEAQEAAQVRADIAKEKASDATVALKYFAAKYPNAEVTSEAGFDYRGNRRWNSRDYAPDRVKVKTDNGHIEFSVNVDAETGEVKESVWKRSIGKELNEQINALILG